MNILKKLWIRITEPAPFDKAWDRLQSEKKVNGMSSEYWRIWREEVCPAFRQLSEDTSTGLRYPDTDHILDDMEKPISERKYF